MFKVEPSVVSKKCVSDRSICCNNGKTSTSALTFHSFYDEWQLANTLRESHCNHQCYKHVFSHLQDSWSKSGKMNPRNNPQKPLVLTTSCSSKRLFNHYYHHHHYYSTRKIFLETTYNMVRNSLLLLQPGST
jgi:hypothetical protein